MRRRLVALGCWWFAFAAASVFLGKPESWDAESLCNQGQRELLAGRRAAAAVFFRGSLEANPYSAAVWLKRAEAASRSGEEDNEIELIEMASRLEPFTFRTEWQAAQALLRRQRWEQASARLHRLAEALPDVHPAIFRAAFQAGMPTARVTASVVPGNGAGTWLRVLAEQEAWAGVAQTLAQWTGSHEVAASPHDLRYVFDKLFQRRQQRLMQDLWQIVRGDDLPEPLSVRSLPAHAGNSARYPGSLIRLLESEAGLASGTRTGTVGSPLFQDRFAFGFGFQWTSRPASGVLLHIHETSPAGPYFELDFRSPAVGESVHLSHYLAVTPETRHVLKAPLMANLTGGEVRLEVWSTGRLLGSSQPIRRSEPWRSVNLPFRTEAGEQVLQLRVVSRAAVRKAMRGRFLLGTIRVQPASAAPRLRAGA